MVSMSNHERPAELLQPPAGSPRSLPGHTLLAAAAVALISLVLYTAGSLTMRSGHEATRYGVLAEAWSDTLRSLKGAGDAAGLRVRYAHDLPEGWQLLAITARREDGTVAAEIAYGRQADGVGLTIRQRRMAPPPAEFDEIAVTRGTRLAWLRRLPDDVVVVVWRDGPVWVEATSRLAAGWDASDLLLLLDSVY